jgi:UDP-glucuronate decarboxylase
MNSTESGPMNLGNPNEFTLIQLLEKIGLIIGKPYQIEYSPLPMDDPKKRNPKIDQASSLLGWSPKVQLEEGLIPTITWIKSKIL